MRIREHRTAHWCVTSCDEVLADDRARVRPVALQRREHVAGVEVQLEQAEARQAEVPRRELHGRHRAVAEEPFER